ncbi:MAG TPA: PhzF family phenazine biosynthesis protein [Burkholderiales bacterium]|nr:PhzF family phenazine biosynthesis protein [Burkholderiales bacterium]
MRRFKQVDVFTAQPFRGNPVAVVIDAEGLDGATMQRIARWTNLSETTFLLPSTIADYKLRIFTPLQELPFAGHPTLGSAHAALESGFVPKKKQLRQECLAGVMELTVDGAEIFVRGPEAKIGEIQAAKIARTLGIPAKQFLRVDVGAVWVIAEVASADALAAMKPDMTALADASNELHAAGVTVFAASGKSEMHVRSFAPAHAIPEDPVCGTGNLSIAAYLRHTSQLERFGNRYVARQGMQLGRDGRVSVRVDADGVRIGGPSVTCIDGSLNLK